MKLSSGLKTGVILILFVGFFIVLNLTDISKGFKNIFYSISSPSQKVFWGLGNNISDFIEGVLGAGDLQKDKENLEKEVQELLAENARLKELKKENEILRDALNIGMEKDFSLILAKVTGKDISQEFILIDKGSKDGVLKDYPVVNSSKILVGKIYEVYDNFSKVMLLTNKDISFDAKVSEKDIFGVIKGGSNGGSFNLVPREKEIKEGDLVVSASLGGLFPEGLLVGKIDKVFRLDEQPFQSAQIFLFFDVKELDELFIITEF